MVARGPASTPLIGVLHWVVVVVVAAAMMSHVFFLSWHLTYLNTYHVRVMSLCSTGQKNRREARQLRAKNCERRLL